MDFEALGLRRTLEVEQVRPRPDDGHQAHDQFLADRVDRRIGHLGEVLLEIGEQRFRPVRQRRDRRVVAHRADRFLAGRRHRRHQDFQVFLGVAEHLLAIEQRQVRDRRRFRSGRQILEHDLGALQPFLVGVAARQLRFQLLVGNEPALVEIDQQHLARLQPPLLDDVGFRNRQHADFGGHDDAVVAGDDIARRAQAVAVERGADLPAVGERDRRRAVPRLHQRGVVFVEGAALFVHELIAGPRLRNHHHHRMRKRVAAHGQKFERIVEARGVGLALVGDRPQFVDVGAEFRRRDGGLARGHPVVVAAQRVDFAVMRDHAVGMRQRPGRERVGGEALMHQSERAREIRIAQVGIIGAELIGEKHALVDQRAAGDRDRVIVRRAPRAPAVEQAGDSLAKNIEPALELVLGLDLRVAGEKDLLVHRLGRLDRFAERRIVGRHVAPAENFHALARRHGRVSVHDLLAPSRVVRQKQRADGVVARRRQFKAERGRLFGEEFVRGLHQYAGAVAGARIGADRAAVLEIEQDRQRVLDDLVRFASLDVGNKSDPAGIFFQRRIKQAET